jgi:hypothetical protein
VELAQTAHNQRLGVGVMLWGEAGVGKSHLLARLARWAGQGQNAYTIYFHNLQARAESLPRYVLHCVVSNLTHGRTNRLHRTPLFELVKAVIRTAVKREPGPPYSWAQVQRGYEDWVDTLLAQDPARAPLIDRSAYSVLLQFFHSAALDREIGQDDGVAALAVDWLSGNALEVADATRLELRSEMGPTTPVVLRDEQHIKQVLIAIAQTALIRGQPLLLCFDQVDNLEREQLATLSRFLHALLDSTPNLFVVTCGVQEALLRFHEDKVIQDSAWDRLAQFTVGLQRISSVEARQIVEVRLKPFLEPFREIAPLPALIEKDSFFPLGAAWYEDFLQGKLAVRPRDTITWAREGWRREQEAMRSAGISAWLANWGRKRAQLAKVVEYSEDDIRALIDAKVDQKVEEHQRQRQRESHTLPADPENLAGLIFRLLQQCLNTEGPCSILGVRQTVAWKHRPHPKYDLIVRQHAAGGGELTSGMLFLAATQGSQTAHYLRRLVQDPRQPDRVFRVMDERRLPPAGPKGRDLMRELQQRGATAFQAIEMRFTDYAQLDALQAVVAMAQSGDLEVEAPPGTTRRVSDQEVIASHHRRAGTPVTRRYGSCSVWN